MATAKTKIKDKKQPLALQLVESGTADSARKPPDTENTGADVFPQTRSSQRC